MVREDDMQFIRDYLGLDDAGKKQVAEFIAELEKQAGKKEA